MTPVLCSTLLTLSLLAAAPHAGAAQTPAAENADTVGREDCRIVNRNSRKDEDATWSGPCKDGYAHGEGTLVWTVGGKQSSRYEGGMRRGLRHGLGYSIDHQGNQYEGGFADGKREGKGTLVEYDGTEYSGDWKAGRRNGIGSLVYLNGARYDGAFDHDTFNGQGRAVYIGGQVFEGQFVQGRRVEQTLPSPGEPERERGREQHALKEESFSKKGRPNLRQPGNIWSGTTFPMDKKWEQFTDEQRRSYRAHYPLLHETDEPPFPVAGMRKMLELIKKAWYTIPANGDLDVSVKVDKDGKPTSVKVFLSPDPDLTQIAGMVMMAEKFKPGLCGGTPCASEFRLSFSLD
jgi:hypothetical protein